MSTAVVTAVTSGQKSSLSGGTSVIVGGNTRTAHGKAATTRCIDDSAVGFKGYGIAPAQLKAAGSFTFSDGAEYSITHGSVIIAAITSCTNTSNPSVMLGAGEHAVLTHCTYHQHLQPERHAGRR
ncbi:Iron regulatory protein 1 [Operophtera brumata]|uniref:Iron regulatory protein 1 n=1 Tax=Operophtera brumata TaxID=104452 RepID=A0A0L7KS30_OPEBR|nr:Iron regulatory protein 1 [Operophtera brumata]